MPNPPRSIWNVISQIVALVALLAGAFLWASNVDTKTAVIDQKLSSLEQSQKEKWEEIKEDIKEIKRMLRELERRK